MRDLPFTLLVANLAGVSQEPLIAPAPSLIELLERKASYREVHREVEQWILACTLAGNGGNLTSAASTLNTTRRLLRRIRDSPDLSPADPPE